MGKTSTKRNASHNNNTGVSMTTVSINDAKAVASEIKKEEAQVEAEMQNALRHAEEVEIKKEALGYKPEAEETKEEKKKEGIIKLVSAIPSTVFNKGILPAYEFCKGIVTRAWGSAVAWYNSEVALFKEMGASRYLLGRTSKIAIKGLKIAALVTVASFLNNMLIQASGISLFDPTTMMFVAFAALLAVVIKSYLDQKDVGAKFSASVTGSHIVDSITAA